MFAAVGPLDNSVPDAAMGSDLQQQRIIVTLLASLQIGLREHVQIFVDQGNVVDVCLTAQLFDLPLNIDLLAKIEDVIGVGMDGDNAGKTARGDRNAKCAAFPKFFFGDFGRWIRLVQGQAPAPAPHEHHGAAVLDGFIRWSVSHAAHHFLHTPGARRGESVEGAPVGIEQFDFAEAIGRGDLLERLLIGRRKLQQLVDEPGVVEQALANQLFEQRIGQHRSADVGLHGVGQRQSFGFGLAQQLVLKTPRFKKNIDADEPQQQQDGKKKIARQYPSTHERWLHYASSITGKESRLAVESS